MPDKGHWRKSQAKDRYFRQAKEDGYRSRSAYKLLQMHERFELIRAGDHVLDLGAAPGGWSQVVARLVGAQGRVIAIDLLPMEAIPGVLMFQGDMTSVEMQAQIRATAEGQVDVVLCDAAPPTSGIRDRDHARSIELAESALQTARELLRPGGHFAVKVFEGELFPQYLDEVRRSFASARAHSPAASRDESREMYVVAKQFRG